MTTMTTEQITQKVKVVIARKITFIEQMGDLSTEVEEFPTSRINLHDTLVSLGFFQTDVFYLARRLEEEFWFSFDVVRLQLETTVQDIINFIEYKLKEQ